MTAEAWIVSAGRVLASAHVAANRAERRRGLLGHNSFDGAFVLPQCRWVHTIGMRFPIDVAFIDIDNRVIKIIFLKRFRLCAPVRQSTMVIEAQHGALARWGVRVGDVIEIRSSTDIPPNGKL